MANSLSRWLLILMAGIAIGALAMWTYQSSQGVKPHIVEGYSTGTNYEMSALSISAEPGGGGNGYIIAGARWREFDGPWHDQGSPPSLAFPSSGQKLRLGVIDYKSTEKAFGGSVVVWYEVVDVKNKVIP